MCSTKLRLGLLLVATAASVACIDPPQPQNSHKAAHRRRCKQKNTKKYARHPRGARTSRITQIATQLGLSARTHRLQLGPKPHRYATHQQSAVAKKGRQKKEKRKKARTVQAASVGACKEEAASPSQQLVQRQHQGVKAGKQTGGAGMRCVGGRIGGGGEGGGERDTWATHVTRGVMQRSVGV